MRKIIYTRPDGGLSVIHPVIDTQPSPEDITEQEALDRAFAKLPADAIAPQIVDESVIPKDRAFRNAWKAGLAKIEIDMSVARELHKNKLRDLRQPLLDALDGQYMKALQAGDQAAQVTVAAQAQALRDVTADSAIAAAATPAELAAVIPDILKASVPVGIKTAF